MRQRGYPPLNTGVARFACHIAGAIHVKKAKLILAMLGVETDGVYDSRGARERFRDHALVALNCARNPYWSRPLVAGAALNC